MLPSEQLAKPHSMACVNVVCAETDAEAKKLFTTLQQAFTDLHRGTRGLSKPPIDDIETYWTPAEKYMATGMLRYSFVGSPSTVKKGLERFVTTMKLDELMITGMMFDHDARKRSYELVKGLWD